MNNLVAEWEEIKVGSTIHNENGEDYIVVAINPGADRTLLVKKDSKTLFYVGAWALQKRRIGLNEYYYWGQGHYFMSDLDAAINYVMDIKRKIYTVNRQAKIDYDFSVEVTKHGCFESKEAAYKKLNEVIDKMKSDLADDMEKYSNADEYPDEESGALAIDDDRENGVYAMWFGDGEDYESHMAWVEEWEVK